MTRIAIVGAGKGGKALLELFHASEDVQVIAIADRYRDAPGLKTAMELNVPVADSIKDICAMRPDVVINVTNEPAITRYVKDEAPYPVEVLEGRGARLLWELVEKQKRGRTDLAVLYRTGLSLNKAVDLDTVLEAVVKSAMELTGMTAGFIALTEGSEMAKSACMGLSRGFLENQRWSPSKSGLTSFILSHTEPVDFPDIERDPLFKDSYLRMESIRALLAAPLRMESGAIGILYLCDFKPVVFDERHRSLIKLFSSQAAHAIEKFRLMNRLEESLESLQNIFNDSQDMLIATDNDARIIRFSRGGERILGYSQAEVLGKKAEEFYRDANERQDILRMLREKGAVINHETTLLRKDGSPVDISLTISVLRDRSGRAIGTVGVSKDITVEKRLRGELEELNRNLEDKVFERTRELEKINRELKKANELKGRFISNASHELRTPLHSIIGFAEVLLDKSYGDMNEKQMRYANTIMNAGKHLLHLINNILDLAKIEAGKAQLSYETFTVGDTVADVVSVIRPLADGKRIALNVETMDGIPAFTADRGKFKQILYNLLSNAIKFSPEGADVHIHALLEVNRGEIQWAPKGLEFLKVSVRDTGPGIKPEDRERIFEEFEQLDPSKTTEGTGLGLSLTKKLVEIHGGQIEVGGRYGEGAVFDVYLPYVADEIGGEIHLAGEAGAVAYPEVRRDNPVVLVAEDDLPTVELLTIHLTQAGYTVAHAYDGAEAVAKAKELKPFVITLDIMLPKKDGWEVLQELKADPSTRDIPVVIHSIIENRELGFALGATDYLVKPVDHSALIDRIKGFVKNDKRKQAPVNVLLISADSATRDRLYGSLQTEGLLLHSAADEDGGIEIACATRPNAIMVDVEDAEKGFDTIKKIRSRPSLKDVPLFVLTSRDLPREERASITGQVERILRKDSLSSGELVSHLKSLEVLYPEKAGLVDEVTLLFNRRYLKMRLAQEVSRAKRYKTPLVFFNIDIDHFGHYVSHKGPYYGNLVMKKLAELLKRSIRGSDVLVRYGRSSFGLVLTNTFFNSSAVLARRFLSMVHDYPFLYEEVQPGAKITISIGAAEFSGQAGDDIVSNAEAALFEAKRKGGNTLEFHRDDGKQ